MDVWFLERKTKEDIKPQVPREFSITEVAATQSSDMRESKRDWMFRVQVLYKCWNPCLFSAKKRELDVYLHLHLLFILYLKVPHLEKNEVVYVVGNLPEVGAWNHNQAIPMSQEHNSRGESPVLFDSNSSGEFYNEDGQDGINGIFDEEEK